MTTITVADMNAHVTAKNPRVSPAHNRFNKLIQQTEAIQRKIAALNVVTSTYRTLYATRLLPLQHQQSTLEKHIAQRLQERLLERGLSNRQRQTASAIIARLMGTLEIEKPKKTQETEAPPKTERKATAARRKKEEKSAAIAHDANGALRTIYRQLASALHPDREPDAQEQIRKTTLMKEVNTAYEKRDLFALLQLLPPTSTITHDKLEEFTVLLKERVSVLQEQYQQLEYHAQIRFGLAPHHKPTADTVESALEQYESQFQQAIHALEHDVLQLQENHSLKAWLNSL